MPAAHTEDMSRSCGDQTAVMEQTFVKIEGKLWAVVGSMIKGGSGGAFFNPPNRHVTIEGKRVICVGDETSDPDSNYNIYAQHHNAQIVKATEGSDFVTVTD